MIVVDIEQLKREWRRTAAARGIDAAAGATGYQVAAFRAEQAKAATRRAQDGWWADPELWEGFGSARSSTEEEALDNVWWSATYALIERLAEEAEWYADSHDPVPLRASSETAALMEFS